MGPRTAWSDTYPVLGCRAENQSNTPFHTLPIAFERGRFIIPDEPPPWSIDIIDEHYLGKALKAFNGHALCLSEEEAKRWRTMHIVRSGFITELDPSSNATSSAGRPRKQDSALAYYWRLYPTGHSCSLKTVCQEIERAFGLSVATKTLDRAIKSAGPAKMPSGTKTQLE